MYGSRTKTAGVYRKNVSVYISDKGFGMKKMAFAVLSALVFVGCSIEYTYEVKGDAPTALISYTNSQGSISQETEAKLPWKKSFTGYVGDAVTVSAQNNGDKGSVVVEIYKKGELFKSGESVGAYGIATAGGSL